MVEFNLFPGGKHHVLTFSYDDGKEEDRKLVELFNHYGMKATFHLNSGFLDTPRYVSSNEVKDLYRGHEVACHTVHHPKLTDLQPQEILKEILDDKANLEALCRYPVRGLSLPGGNRNPTVDDTIRQSGIRYCRTSQFTMTYQLPVEYLKWHPSCHHNQLPDMLDFFLKAQDVPCYAQAFYVMGHSYEFTQQNNWSMMEECCKKLSFLPDTWYATNIEIYDYRMAQMRVQYTADYKVFHNPSAIDVWATVNGEEIQIKGGQTVYL